MNIHKIISILYLITAITVFIANIAQPLERWVVGAWIIMAGYFGSSYLWQSSSKHTKRVSEV